MRFFVAFLWFLIVASNADSQIGDFNGDAEYDCRDLEILQSAFGGDDLQFDLDGNGKVEYRDTDAWLSLAGNALGYEIVDGDYDFDGDVDHRDYNVLAINHQSQVSGWCRADTNGDGAVDSQDRAGLQTNWTHGVAVDSRGRADVELLPLPTPTEAWTGGGIVFVRTNVFDLIARPQLSPEGVLSSFVSARMHDESHRFVSVDGVMILGDVHQVGIPAPFHGMAITPTSGIHMDSPAEWIAFDSHILLQFRYPGRDVPSHPFPIHPTIDAGSGQGAQGLSEVIDLSDPTGQAENLIWMGLEPVLGIGDITMRDHDIFSLSWEFRSSEYTFAQIVTPISPSGEPGNVTLSIGLQGADSNDASLPDTGSIEAVPVPFFFLPCDFDHDSKCESSDLESLVAVVGDENATYNLDDSPIVNSSDIQVWLAFASLGNDIVLFPGDTNLDGAVDSVDLNQLGTNWQAVGEPAWSQGDFNGDGMVNALDLNQIGIHWQHRGQLRSMVPEPAGHVPLLCVLAGFLAISARMNQSPFQNV